MLYVIIIHLPVNDSNEHFEKNISAFVIKSLISTLISKLQAYLTFRPRTLVFLKGGNPNTFLGKRPAVHGPNVKLAVKKYYVISFSVAN